jgi:hypothetical protein
MGSKLYKMFAMSRHSNKVRYIKRGLVESYRGDRSSRHPDTDEPLLENGTDWEYKHQTPQSAETLADHEEEVHQVVEETSAPDEAPTPDDQWDLPVPVSMTKNKKKGSKRTSRPIEMPFE